VLTANHLDLNPQLTHTAPWALVFKREQVLRRSQASVAAVHWHSTHWTT